MTHAAAHDRIFPPRNGLAVKGSERVTFEPAIGAVKKNYPTC
jgi:hypothetical protein